MASLSRFLDEESLPYCPGKAAMCKRAVIWGLPACWSALIALGCSGANSPVPVKGVVKLDGNPLAGATVTFMPAGDSGRPATGETDQEGVFRLTSLKKDDGAFPGEYRVVVTKIQAIDPPPPANSGEPDAVLKHYQSLKSQKRTALLPSPYASYLTTPLRCTVPTAGEVVLEM
jgi:hypothetical protein